MNKTMISKRKKEFPAFIKCLLAAAFTISVCAVIIFTFSFALYLTEDPISCITPCAYAALCLSAFLAGIFSSKITDKQITGGIISGAVLCALMLILSLFFKSSVTTAIKIVVICAVPLTTITGSLTANAIFGRSKRNSKVLMKYKKMR